MADRALKELQGFVLFGNKMVNKLIFSLDVSVAGIGITLCEAVK